jgi:hypothetical protein
MSDQPQGCARITGTVSSDGSKDEDTGKHLIKEKEVKMAVLVGQKAPDFAAPAYQNGGFSTVKLSDFLGKWVLLCFYPGDFTFV